ncbi:MAG: toll/interleukin-1 receptor domain-containing protein [Bacteroidales bacterium]|nr:toll/interleukin-1 receptor domain-containing protein [Bacteroidales bacterium]
MDIKEDIIFKEEHYDRLIELIKEGSVIPILGEGVLKVEYDGIDETLYYHIAQYIDKKEHIDKKELPNDKIESLYDVVHHLRKRNKCNKGKDKYCYHAHIQEFLKNNSLKCDALEKLARITDFKMFISTTFDDLAIKTIERIRNIEKGTTKYWEEDKGETKKRDENKDNERGNDVDIDPPVLPENDIKSSKEIPNNTVYHLFGTYNKDKENTFPPKYAITDDDILFYLSKMVNGRFQTTKISSLLKKADTHLLLLGWSHSDWLYRFMVYTLKKERVYMEDSDRHIIYSTDDKTESNESLHKFMNRVNAFFYEGNSFEFIEELYNRWEKTPKTDPEYCPDNPDIFISYARDDLETVEKVYEWLKKFNCKIWFDKKKLRHGDRWEEKIKKAIEDCKIFIPILSETTAIHLLEGKRFFTKEWERACKRQDDRSRVPESFIVPIRIDDVRQDDESFRKQFGRLHIDDFQLENEECMLKLEKVIRERLPKD